MYKVAIKNNKTNEVRVTTQNVDWLEGSLFWWTDGNMGCDCNRAIDFDIANGADINRIDIRDYPCGKKGYSIEWFEFNGVRKTIEEMKDLEE